MRERRVIRRKTNGKVVKQIGQSVTVVETETRRTIEDRMHLAPTRRNLTRKQWRQRGEILKSLSLRRPEYAYDHMPLADLIEHYEQVKTEDMHKAIQSMKEQMS